jgi:hypothetical protein
LERVSIIKAKTPGRKGTNWELAKRERHVVPVAADLDPTLAELRENSLDGRCKLVIGTTISKAKQS